MRLSRIGEFGLINSFRNKIKLDASVIRGSGDDCAVIRFRRGRHMLFTCDMIVEGVDFTRRSDPYLIGRKALAVNLSDIAACAGVPRYCLVSLGLPARASVAKAEKIFQGINRLAKAYGVNVVGGDISRAPAVTIDISLIGFVEAGKLVLRSGARPGDIIFVSGPLGGSILGKHFHFTPRVKEARELAKNFRVHAMIDISDGLAQDLGHILRASGCAAALYESLIPLSKNARGLEDALYSGEDFELLFTISLKDARRLLRQRPGVFQPIGEIREKGFGLKLVDKRGRQRSVPLSGFRHF
jgi:thiamine-monophosphate kinase